MMTLKGFAPDLPPMTEGVITDCENIVPTEKGYKAAEKLVPAIENNKVSDEKVIGAALVTRLDNVSRLIVGAGGKLIELRGDSWVDQTRDSGDYSSGAENRWRFVQFGNDTLAANQLDVIQYSRDNKFEDIPGAPKARIIEAVSGFVMAFGIVDEVEGDMTDMWWCSALYNHLDWTPDVATNSANGRLIDSPGEIRAAKKLGNSIVAYKEKSMYLGHFVGPPVIWQWQQIPGEIGAVSHESVVSIDTAHLFISSDDFWYFDGSRPVSIGAPVHRWFFENRSPEFAHHTTGYYDRINGLVYWYFVNKNSDSGTLNDCLVYNVITRTWGRILRSINAVVEFKSSGVTYDQLGDLYSTFDDFTGISYKSPRWFYRGSVTAVIDNQNRLMLADGGGMDSKITTGIIGDDAYYTTLKRVRPRFSVNPRTGLMATSHSSGSGLNMQDSGNAPAVLHDGKFDTLRSARWHKMMFSFTGNMEISALDVDLIRNGYR